MSVYWQHHRQDDITLADDLEAFLHVLVWQCLNLMESNISSGSSFRASYFLNYTCIPTTGEMVGPEAKRASLIHCGKLTSTGVEDITFYSEDRSVRWWHGMNKLIAELIKTFHTRYVVWKWEQDTKECAALDEPPPERPPQHVFDTAASLSEHAGVRSLIGRMLHDDSLCWPVQDLPHSEDMYIIRHMEDLKASDYANYVPPTPAVVANPEAAQDAPVADPPAADPPAAENQLAEVPVAEAPVAEDPVAKDPVAEPRAVNNEDTRPPKRRRIARRDELVADATAQVERRVTRSRTAAQANAATRVTRSRARQAKGAGPSAGKGGGAAGRPRRR